MNESTSTTAPMGTASSAFANNSTDLATNGAYLRLFEQESADTLKRDAELKETSRKNAVYKGISDFAQGFAEASVAGYEAQTIGSEIEVLNSQARLNFSLLKLNQGIQSRSKISHITAGGQSKQNQNELGSISTYTRGQSYILEARKKSIKLRADAAYKKLSGRLARNRAIGGLITAGINYE